MTRLAMLGRLRTSTLAIGLGVAGIAASGAWGSAGCSATKPTELVPGAITQVNIPKSLSGLRVQVYANGSKAFDNSYQVVNGVAFLPATLGIVSQGNASTKIEVLIAGFDDVGINAPMSQWGDPTVELGTVGSPGGPRVKRGSIQTYVDQHTLFLPMNLSYSCWGQDCEGDGGTNSGNTCKAASCVTNETDPHTLVDFDPSLIDGTQDCFSPSKCFNPDIPPGIVTAELLDPDTCAYGLPQGVGVKYGSGLNVRVIYQDLKLDDAGPPYNDSTSEQEVLNVEPYDTAHGLPAEGFAVPDANKPYNFVLAKGLCQLVKNASVPPAGFAGTGKHYHTISAVQVSTTCPSKPPLLPVCSFDQNQPSIGADGGPGNGVVCNQPITLVQAPSAIYLVMDDSSIMAGAFGKDGYATTMGLALGNPLFKRTYVAFEFMDHLQSDCTTDAGTLYTKPGENPTSLEFTLANVAQPNIAKLLLAPPYPEVPAGQMPPDGGQPDGGFAPLFLQGAMRLDVGAFKHLSDFASALASHKDGLEVGAVMFFINRQPDSTGTVFTYLDGGTPGNPPALFTPPFGQDCHPALDTAADTNAQAALEEQIIAADAKGLQSYFVVLNNGLYQIGQPLTWFQTVQNAVKAKGVKTMQVLDATEPKSQIAQILGRFSNTATALGTCLYELPPGIDSNAKLSFTVPVLVPGVSSQVPPPFPIPVAPDPNCNAANQDTANGWAIEGTHIRICGSFCQDLRLTVEGVAASVLLSQADGGVPAADAGSPVVPEVPVTITQPCVGNDGGAP